jgi:hypothetical protein
MLVGILANEGNSPNFQEKLAEAASFQLIEELHGFRAYLTGSLAVILNGVVSSKTAVARGGKLGYALHFLDHLDQALDRAINEANLLPTDNPNSPVDSIDRLRQLISQFRQVSGETARKLRQKAGQLSQQLRSSEEEDGAPGLYEQCAHIEQACSGYLTEMDRILTRRYIHTEGLLEKWQQTYLFNNELQEDALRRVHWRVDEEGDLQLALQAWEEQAITLRPDKTSQEQFLQGLYQIAAYITQEIWEKETLATVLAQTALHPRQIDQTTSDLHIGSAPLLNYDEFKAPNAVWGVVLGVNKTISQAGALETALRAQMSAERQLNRQSITDPFSLLVAQTVDVLPVSAIPSITAAGQVYQSWYGLLPNTPADQRAEPTAVFRAERIALMLEQRLQPELQQLARILRPIIVTALDAGGVARFYALAVGADWVTYTTDTVTLSLPDGNHITVAIARDEPIHPLIRGFITFAAKASTTEVQTLQAAISAAESDTIAAWRQWTRSDWQMLPRVQELRADGLDGVDLATVVALVARDEVKRRQQAD